MPNLSKSLLKRDQQCKPELEASAADERLSHDAAPSVTNAACPCLPHNNHAASCASTSELTRIGHQIADAVRPDGDCTMAFVDVWTAHIVPLCAIDRLARTTATIPKRRRPPPCFGGMVANFYEW